MTDERNAATRVAKNDWEKALSLARKVSDSWFRCQALAHVARVAPDKQVVSLAEEAISAALTATDSYKRVAVAAWPLRALLERNQEPKAIQLLPAILAQAAQIENPVSRSDALFLLWQAFFPAQGQKTVLGALVKSCAGHWKADYILRQAVLIWAREDMDEARKLAASMPESKYKRQAQTRLAEGQTEQARQFF